MIYPLKIITWLCLSLWVSAPVIAQGVRASSANDDANWQREKQTQRPHVSSDSYVPPRPSAITTAALPSGAGTSPEMADHYRQAAQQSRQAASQTKCPENKRYYTAMAQYCDCLADQLRTGSSVTCAQPAGQPIDCPQDASSVHSSTGKADFSQLADSFANLDPGDAETSLKTIKTQIRQMRDELASESNPDASTRNMLRLLSDMLNTSDLTQLMTSLQQFIGQAANDN